jgi:predicted O-methyltransferase YrrM
MVLEAIMAPAQIRQQKRDWRRLIQRMPVMGQLQFEQDVIEKSLAPSYKDYISNFSSPLISISLNRAVLLAFLAKTLRPGRILDLGSGYSSYVFRTPGISEAAPETISVDDSEQWLSETRKFLLKHGCSTKGLVPLHELLDESNEFSPPKWDLCFLDIGDFDLRKRILPRLFDAVVECKSILVIDDFHVRAYRNFIIDLNQQKKTELFSLRKVTRRRLSHAALVLAKSQEI